MRSITFKDITPQNFSKKTGQLLKKTSSLQNTQGV